MRTVDPLKHAQRRQQVLDAALRCFAAKGLHKTRTADICAEAGMSPGNLFHYFPDKNALILALVEADQAQTTQRYEAAGRAAAGWPALLELLDEHLAACADRVYLQLSLDVLSEAARNPGLMACVQRNEATRRDSLCALLARHAAGGQLRLHGSAEAAADWFLLLLDGALGRCLVAPGQPQPPSREDLVAALQLRVQPAADAAASAS